MQTFILRHEIHCSEETFWKLFFDQGFNEALFKKELGFPRYDTTKLDLGEKQIVRKVLVTPKMDAPGAVAKLIGSSFGYDEEGTFDRATKVFKWRSIPSTMQDKLRIEGTVRLEGAGEGKVRRLADFQYEAKVFGVGGMIESTLEKSLRSGWDRSAEFMERWVKEHGLT